MRRVIRASASRWPARNSLQKRLRASPRSPAGALRCGRARRASPGRLTQPVSATNVRRRRLQHALASSGICRGDTNAPLQSRRRAHVGRGEAPCTDRAARLRTDSTIFTIGLAITEQWILGSRPRAAVWARAPFHHRLNGHLLGGGVLPLLLVGGVVLRLFLRRLLANGLRGFVTHGIVPPFVVGPRCSVSSLSRRRPRRARAICRSS